MNIQRINFFPPHSFVMRMDTRENRICLPASWSLCNDSSVHRIVFIYSRTRDNRCGKKKNDGEGRGGEVKRKILSLGGKKPLRHFSSNGENMGVIRDFDAVAQSYHVRPKYVHSAYFTDLFMYV